VLVLENEHTMEGDIERSGNQYRIRRAVGETWVPADQVLCLCASYEEAYAFLCTRTNLRDADERLRLARWCLLYGLRTQALAEATAAVELRPGMPEGRHLLSSLQRSAAAAACPPSPLTASGDAPRNSAGDEAEPPVSLLPPLDLGVEALSLFATRVQPILMNTCVSCHASNRAGAFRLTRAGEGGVFSRRATQQNLAAVLAQINRERPAASPLLLKAVCVHGEASQAPLKSRQSPAFRTLEEWVRLALANNPQLEERRVAAAPPELKMESPSQSAFPVLANLPGEVISTPPAAASRSAEPAPSAPPPLAPTPSKAETTPVDPFDPAIFNRQMHPK
jgi:hypothetical protein